MWKEPIPAKIAPFLWVLLALGILVAGYGLYWKFVKTDLLPTLAPVATTGGVQGVGIAPPDPVLTATAEVPKTKAGADVRSYLTPSGETILTVEPRKEGFFGWEPFR